MSHSSQTANCESYKGAARVPLMTSRKLRFPHFFIVILNDNFFLFEADPTLSTPAVTFNALATEPEGLMDYYESSIVVRRYLCKWWPAGCLDLTRLILDFYMN